MEVKAAMAVSGKRAMTARARRKLVDQLKHQKLMEQWRLFCPQN